MDIKKMKEKDIVAKLQEMGVEATTKDSKAENVAKLEAAMEAHEAEMAAQPDARVSLAKTFAPKKR